MSGVVSFTQAATVVLIVLLNAQQALGELTWQQKSDLFQEAQEAYDRGIAALMTDPVHARQSFTDAAARFQTIVDDGKPSGPLLYNLANAYLQSGDIGRAILSYRRAELMLPANARLQNNLHYARSLVRSQIESSERQDLARALLGWHERTPLSWRFTAFATLNGALWCVLTWLIVRQGAGQRWTAALLAVAWLAIGASIAADLAGVGQRTGGVLLVDEVVMRKGNGVGFQPKFEQPLHAGVEFRVLEHRGDWLHVRLRNGEDGWIETSAAALIG